MSFLIEIILTNKIYNIKISYIRKDITYIERNIKEKYLSAHYISMSLNLKMSNT